MQIHKEYKTLMIHNFLHLEIVMKIQFGVFIVKKYQ
jgi:hypothetical protein